MPESMITACKICKCNNRNVATGKVFESILKAARKTVSVAPTRSSRYLSKLFQLDTWLYLLSASAFLPRAPQRAIPCPF